MEKQEKNNSSKMLAGGVINSHAAFQVLGESFQILVY